MSESVEKIDKYILPVVPLRSICAYPAMPISLELGSDFAAMLMLDVMKGGAHCGGAKKLYAHPQFKAWEKKHGKTFSKAAR